MFMLMLSGHSRFFMTLFWTVQREFDSVTNTQYGRLNLVDFDEALIWECLSNCEGASIIAKKYLVNMDNLASESQATHFVR